MSLQSLIKHLRKMSYCILLLHMQPTGFGFSAVKEAFTYVNSRVASLSTSLAHVRLQLCAVRTQACRYATIGAVDDFCLTGYKHNRCRYKGRGFCPAQSTNHRSPSTSCLLYTSDCRYKRYLTVITAWIPQVNG